MKCEVLVDWLTFSVKEKDPAKVIREYLGMDPSLLQDIGYGLMGYNRVLRFSDICVCSEGREDNHFHDMGVCVSMLGNGCRSFETMSKLSFPGAKDTHRYKERRVSRPVPASGLDGRGQRLPPRHRLRRPRRILGHG